MCIHYAPLAPTADYLTQFAALFHWIDLTVSYKYSVFHLYMHSENARS